MSSFNDRKHLDLSVNLGGLKMKNPVTVASGCFGSGREYDRLWRNSGVSGGVNSLGAITTKGVSFEPWLGNPGIRLAESASGVLNSIGLQNKGVEMFIAEDLSWLARQDVEVIVNVCGHQSGEYRRVVERLNHEAAISAFEINISCPNVSLGGMSFGTDVLSASTVVSECREATKKPMLVKLSPNVTDITEIAKACEAAGADALSLINTVAATTINLEKRNFVFDRVVAGLSGPAIKPIALYALSRVYRAVKLPLLGMGGISTATDALEFIVAGASAVAVGSASFSDPLAAYNVLQGIRLWCEDNAITNIGELIGIANE